MKIFLLSGRAESGKDTFHKIAEEYIVNDRPVARIAFADAVKAISRQLGWNGVKDEKGRSGLIMVGNGAREFFDDDIWVNKALIELQSHYYNLDVYEDSVVFITDCRYPNEIEKVKNWAEEWGCEAYSVRVFRPNHVSKLTLDQLASKSETALDDYVEWDFIVPNDGTMEDYSQKVKEIMNICLLGGD